MEESIVLCVDDDSTLLTALRTLLVKHLGPGHVVDIAASADEALEYLAELDEEERQLAVVISDYIMPGMRGDELLVKLHQLSPSTVNIMLTGQSDLEGVKRAINDANLYRFLEKPFNNADIVLTARAAVKSWQQERELARRHAELQRINADLEALVDARTAELARKNQELERLAVTDNLTGLGNRHRLDQVLGAEMERARRYRHPCSLILLDIDRFKTINDTYGHPTGDAVLRHLGALLAANVRSVDVAGRWGGEEFLIVAANTTARQAADLAEKLRLLLAGEPVADVGQVSASFGVAEWRPDEGLASLLARTDAALYHAKQDGRNRVHVALA